MDTAVWHVENGDVCRMMGYLFLVSSILNLPRYRYIDLVPKMDTSKNEILHIKEVHYGGEGPHWTVLPMQKKILQGSF